VILNRFLKTALFAFCVALPILALAASINYVHPNWITPNGSRAYGGPYFVNGQDMQSDGFDMIVNATYNAANGEFGVVWISYNAKWYSASGKLIKEKSLGVLDENSSFPSGADTACPIGPTSNAYVEFEPVTWDHCDVLYTVHVEIQDGNRNILASWTTGVGTIERNHDLYWIRTF
jgi:hypothetical protein